MAPLDWDSVMKAQPSKLSDEDVDAFYESLVGVSRNTSIAGTCILEVGERVLPSI